MIKKVLYVAKVVSQRGVGFLFRYFFESILFDIKHGTQTSSRVTKDEQTILSTDTDKENGLLYVASFTSVTRDTVSLAKRILGDDRFRKSQFVDLGCGKGKALLVHAVYFGKDQDKPALGIEYDPDLVVIAKDNVKKIGLQEDRVKVVADSAVNLKQYVSSKDLVVYLYNSFQGETLKNVLEELSTVPHVLIYVDPVERFFLDEYGYSVLHVHSGKYHADTWLVASANL
jgi:SAM-dependent methyltransferase